MDEGQQLLISRGGLINRGNVGGPFGCPYTLGRHMWGKSWLRPQSQPPTSVWGQGAGFSGDGGGGWGWDSGGLLLLCFQTTAPAQLSGWGSSPEEERLAQASTGDRAGRFLPRWPPTVLVCPRAPLRSLTAEAWPRKGKWPFRKQFAFPLLPQPG